MKICALSHKPTNDYFIVTASIRGFSVLPLPSNEVDLLGLSVVKQNVLRKSIIFEKRHNPYENEIPSSEAQANRLAEYQKIIDDYNSYLVDVMNPSKEKSLKTRIFHICVDKQVAFDIFDEAENKERYHRFFTSSLPQCIKLKDYKKHEKEMLKHIDGLENPFINPNCLISPCYDSCLHINLMRIYKKTGNPMFIQHAIMLHIACQELLSRIKYNPFAIEKNIVSLVIKAQNAVLKEFKNAMHN